MNEINYIKNINKNIVDIEYRNIAAKKIYTNENIFVKKTKNKQTNKKNSNLFKKKTLGDIISNNQSNVEITLANNNAKIYKKDALIKLQTKPIANKIILKPEIKKVDSFANKKIELLDVPKKKRLLIYQKQNMHTEVIGMIMFNFKDYNIDIYHPHYDNSSNSIPYYEEIFSTSITYISHIQEDIYKIIFVLTSGEINFINPVNKKKYIMVNHENGTINNNYFNISLTPIVKSNFVTLPIYEYMNTSTRINQIFIIGSLHSHQRDIPNILKLMADLPMYKICLFTRFVDPKNKEAFLKFQNFKIYEKSDTKTMINEIRKSKFIYTADTFNYTEKGIRGGILTGMVPLGLNNNIPIIMTKRLNTIYNLEGVIVYEKDILEIKDTLASITNIKYNELLIKSKFDAQRICSENKIKFEIIRDKLNEK